MKQTHVSYLLSSFTMSDRPLLGKCETAYPIEMTRIEKKNPKRLTVWKWLSKLNGRSWYRVKSVKSSKHFPRPLDFDKTEPARVQFCRRIWPKSVRNQSPTWRTYTDILGRGSFRSTSPKNNFRPLFIFCDLGLIFSLFSGICL
jgi:hypothetical protein